MGLPTFSEVLAEVERVVAGRGRAALCQIVRCEGSTPGKPGWKMLVRPDGTSFGNLGGGAFEALVQDDARQKLRQRRPGTELKRYYFTEQAVRGVPTGMVCGGMSEVFLEVLMGRPLMVICGGGPVGQALALNAALCDFDLLVADDREEFRRPELFPRGAAIARVDRDYSQDFLEAFCERELLVTVVTRCWETDLAALSSILRQTPSDIRYLGLMGSRRKVARVRQELEDRGFDPGAANLRGPIGLPIGGESPAEIAISILAEIIRTRRGAEAPTTAGAEPNSPADASRPVPVPGPR